MAEQEEDTIVMVIMVPDHNSMLEAIQKFRSVLADFDYHITLMDQEGQAWLISQPFKNAKECYKTMSQMDYWKRYGDNKKMCKAHLKASIPPGCMRDLDQMLHGLGAGTKAYVHNIKGEVRTIGFLLGFTSMHSQRDMTAHIMSIIKEQIFLDWQ
jgi:hypothetical protein